MMAATHVLAGVAAWSATATVLAHPADGAALAAAGLGALLPDIDHPQSWVGRRLRLVSVPIALVFGHRGITHSLIAVGLCLGAMALFGHRTFMLPAIAGYLSHLVCDSLTVGGVPLLWPWRRAFGLRLVRSGSPGELTFALLLILAAGTPLLGHADAVRHQLHRIGNPLEWLGREHQARPLPHNAHPAATRHLGAGLAGFRAQPA